MGPLFFDYGFGPFRWVCTSSDPNDLEYSDKLAIETLEKLAETVPNEIINQLKDNILWIKEAGKNKLVVGSQARILYADCEGRIKIAEAFNPEEDLDAFIAIMIAVEFHELGHIYGFRNGCKKCRHIL